MLLFDENLSAALVSRLADVFPGSHHVDGVGLHGAEDVEIWAYAREHGLMVVTKDDDFRQLSLLYGPPPKLLLLELGNSTTAQAAALLRARAADIGAFAQSQDASLMVLP